MKVNKEFILDGCQYQEVTNSSWSEPLFEYRRRELDCTGDAITDWEQIHRNDFFTARKLKFELMTN